MKIRLDMSLLIHPNVTTGAAPLIMPAGKALLILKCYFNIINMSDN